MPIPELPEPAHADVDSMLSRKFGKEIANYFSGMFTCGFAAQRTVLTDMHRLSS